MTTRSFSFFLCLLLFSLSGKSVNAQSGIISGTVKDDQGEALVGATVLIQGTFVGTTTDFDGNYTLKTSSLGQAKLVCSFISYQSSVKTVTVVDGKVAQVDFILSEASIALNEVQVTARANRESENILLLEQKKAIVASQTIGAQELSRKGISNAEGAVTKIAGISKQEGVKNVFVRGLGDRYNTTTLNGFALPSEDPEYKNISLDFFFQRHDPGSKC